MDITDSFEQLFTVNNNSASSLSSSLCMADRQNETELSPLSTLFVATTGSQ